MSGANAERYRTAGGEVLLRVECDEGGPGFYGFVAVAGGSRVLRPQNEPFFEDRGKRLSSIEEGWYGA